MKLYEILYTVFCTPSSNRGIAYISTISVDSLLSVFSSVPYIFVFLSALAVIFSIFRRCKK